MSNRIKPVTLNKRHFEFIAEMIKELQNNTSIVYWFGEYKDNKNPYRVIANHFATRLMVSNGKFNRDKFLEVCLPKSDDNVVTKKKPGRPRKPGGRTDQEERRKLQKQEQLQRQTQPQMMKFK